MAKYTFTVKDNIKTMTLFDYLKHHAGISSRLFNKMKQCGEFYINGNKSEITSTVASNHSIDINVKESAGDVAPEFIDLDIIYEDDHLLAVNKPPDMVVHPSCYHPYGTLANGIAFHFVSKGLNIPVRPVIRLDKDTSGLVIFSKNALVQQNLIDQMAEGKVKKTYIALVEGYPDPEQGIIDARIARQPGSIITRHVSPEGVSAVTNYKTLDKFKEYSLVEIKPQTGRTHQIRVHMQYIGNPVLGDTLYGTASELINRQALHAYRYEFIHPVSNTLILLECPVPEDIKKLI